MTYSHIMPRNLPGSTNLTSLMPYSERVASLKWEVERRRIMTGDDKVGQGAKSARYHVPFLQVRCNNHRRQVLP